MLMADPLSIEQGACCDRDGWRIQCDDDGGAAQNLMDAVRQAPEFGTSDAKLYSLCFAGPWFMW